MKVLQLAIALLLAASALAAANGLRASAGIGVTKIAPREADPGHPFTVLDTGMARLIDGSVAVFRREGTTFVVALKTREPYKTAQGRLPADASGGTYTVSVRYPDSTETEIGGFTVRAPVISAPTISPPFAAATAAFVISDPEGRMAAARYIVFFSDGQAPDHGTIVADATFGSDGRTASGTVPATLVPQHYFVTVHAESIVDPPLFNALEFTVTP